MSKEHSTGHLAIRRSVSDLVQQLEKLIENEGQRMFWDKQNNPDIQRLKDLVGQMSERWENDTGPKSQVEQQLHTLFEQDLSGTYIVNMDWVIVKCNNEFARILGFNSRADVEGKHHSELYTKEQEDSFKENVVSENSLRDQQTKLLLNNGSYVWMLENATAIFDESGEQKYVMGSLFDITDRKDSELKVIELNQELETKVAQRTSELAEKNKDLTDSINYAKNIQRSILPSRSLIKSHLPNIFISYQPRDIVSGDFYWFNSIPNKHYLYLAVADCTGHGVPGALMSVVCSNALDTALLAHKLTDPADILTTTNEIVATRLRVNSKNIDDGMDISLCRIDTTNGEVVFSGANHPLWVCTKDPDNFQLPNTINGELKKTVSDRNQQVIFEIRGDRQAIGGRHGNDRFKQHAFKFSPNETIYLFTDGITDQFGGPDNRKFRPKNLRKLIFEVQEYRVKMQQALIEDALVIWRGEEPKLDDICMIGFSLTDE